MRVHKGIKTQSREVQRGIRSRMVSEGRSLRTQRSGQTWTLFRQHDFHAVSSRPLKALKREAGLVRCAFRKSTPSAMGRRDWNKTRAAAAFRRCCYNKRKLTRAGGTRTHAHTPPKKNIIGAGEGPGHEICGRWWEQWMVRTVGSCEGPLGWEVPGGPPVASWVFTSGCSREVRPEALTRCYLLRGGTLDGRFACMVVNVGCSY